MYQHHSHHDHSYVHFHTHHHHHHSGLDHTTAQPVLLFQIVVTGVTPDLVQLPEICQSQGPTFSQHHSTIPKKTGVSLEWKTTDDSKSHDQIAKVWVDSHHFAIVSGTLPSNSRKMSQFSMVSLQSSQEWKRLLRYLLGNKKQFQKFRCENPQKLDFGWFFQEI